MLMQAAGNVHYLGRAGLTSLAGLSIAFLDGRFDAAAFSSGDAQPGGGGCRHFTQARAPLGGHPCKPACVALHRAVKVPSLGLLAVSFWYECSAACVILG